MLDRAGRTSLMLELAARISAADRPVIVMFANDSQILDAAKRFAGNKNVSFIRYGHPMFDWTTGRVLGSATRVLVDHAAAEREICEIDRTLGQLRDDQVSKRDSLLVDRRRINERYLNHAG